MKQLNFFPCYADLLRLGVKTTTLRLAETVGLAVGDNVSITTGWDETRPTPIREGRITAVYPKRIKDLSTTDLAGESPDCLTVAAVPLVLSAIYRTVVTPDTNVWVIKFAYA